MTAATTPGGPDGGQPGARRSTRRKDRNGGNGRDAAVSKRDHPKAVAVALRTSVEAAVAIRLTDAERRVYEAVIARTAGWGKLRDSIYVAQLMSDAGTGDRVTRRALAKLATAGAIVWQPARGRGLASTIGLPTENLHDSVPVSDGEKPARRHAALQERKPAQNGPKNLHACVPPPEELSEDARARPAGAASQRALPEDECSTCGERAAIVDERRWLCSGCGSRS